MKVPFSIMDAAHFVVVECAHPAEARVLWMPLIPGTDGEWDVMRLGAENCCVLLEQSLYLRDKHNLCGRRLAGAGPR
jgi:hypothetical protein